MNSFEKFLFWEAKSRDTIDFKKIYVDIADDLIAGLLLSQIIYWYLPDEKGNTKLRVEKSGYLWIAKERGDWYEEVRISPKQFDRASGILIEKGIIIKDHFRFNGMRTVHLRLDYDRFMELWESQMDAPAIPQRSTPQFPKGEDRNSPKVKTGVDQRGRPLTESTTESTTETKKEEIKINFDLPSYPHLDLDKQWVFLNQPDNGDDNLIKVFVTGVTAKRLKLALPDEAGEKMVNPEGRVFYQNGYDELQRVVIGEKQGPTLTPVQVDIKAKLIDMTGAGDCVTANERIKNITKCQEAGIYMANRGNTLEQLEYFETWFPTHWQGKDGEPITLQIISKLWNTAMEAKNGNQRTATSQSSSFGKTQAGKSQGSQGSQPSFSPKLGSGQTPELRAKLEAAFNSK